MGWRAEDGAHHRIQRLLSFVFALSLAAATLAGLLAPSAASAWDVSTQSRTEAQVRAEWAVLRPTYSGTPYVTTPSWVAPYAPGSVQPAFLADGLKAINFGRYLAGLPYDVTLDPTRNLNGQYGAVLLAASNFSHEPLKPADMTPTFYQLGKANTSSSNIGWGYTDSESFQQGCLDDGDPTNIDRVGHRRWLLNPPMKYTGIGFADNRSTTYSWDTSRTAPVNYRFIAWPSAGVFPVDWTSAYTPWSITLNPAVYDWDSTVTGHTVTLRRVTDGVSWTFDATDTNTSGEYFNADFQYYGVPDAFIFRPDPAVLGTGYKAGEQYDVSLSGGIYLKGTRTPAVISYRTSFGALSGAATAFRLATTAPSSPPLVYIENDAAGVTFGRFINGFGTAYSGGSYTYAYSKAPYTGSRLAARFTGSKVRWIGPKNSSYGIAKVYIDGIYKATVDCYSATAVRNATLWQSATLADGPHTISVEMGSGKNPASSGYVVVIDRFEAEGTNPSGGGVRDNETAGTFSGTWVQVTSNPTYTGSSYAYSYWPPAAFSYTFTGTKCAWIGPKANTYGKAAVYLDGVYKGTLSQYAPASATAFRARVWESGALARGMHTLTVRPLGAKDAASLGANIVVDSVDYAP